MICDTFDIMASNPNSLSIASLYHEESAPPWRPLLILVFPILPIFWRYRVDVTATTLTVGYSYAYSSIDRGNIVSAKSVANVNGLTEWGGRGIRYNLRGETGYIVRNGPAVRIEVRKDGKSKVYVFSCEDAAAVCEILGNC